MRRREPVGFVANPGPGGTQGLEQLGEQQFEIHLSISWISTGGPKQIIYDWER